MRGARRVSAVTGQHGASAVEFAIILLPLFLIVFGIIEFGMAYNRSQGAHAAAREGARVASIGRDADEVGDAVIQALQLTQIGWADAEGEIERIDASGTAAQTWTFTGASDSTASVLGPGVPPCDDSAESDRVRVTMRVSNPDDYAINLRVVPIDIDQDFESSGVFRCEP